MLDLRWCFGWMLTCLLGLGAAAPADEAFAEPAPPRAVQEKDFRSFLAWFEGEFDSNEQVAFADELGIPKDAVPERIHSIFRRVELPAFGEHVFYVEQYLDGDPAKIYRQRLYSFSLDDAEQAIRLVIHIPADDPAKAASYGWADPGAERLGINLRWLQASCSQRPSRDAAAPVATSK